MGERALLDAEFERCALEFVSEKRKAHVLGTAETAVWLAERFGADPISARRAALLHDCAKRMSDEEQLKFCDECGIILLQADLNSPAIIHAIAGAELAARNFEISDAEKSAIRWHATGRAGMSPLEKAVYLADYIEPTRRYWSCIVARKLAEIDADAALFAASSFTVSHLVAQGRAVHPKTLELLNDLSK